MHAGRTAGAPQEPEAGSCADVARALGRERAVAEYVIGMHVGVDHVAHGLRRDGADRSQEPLALALAAARVDDRNAILPDHDFESGNATLIFAAHDPDRAALHKDAVGNLLQVQRGDARLRTAAGSPAPSSNIRTAANTGSRRILRRSCSHHGPRAKFMQMGRSLDGIELEVFCR
jgi:hypothetical protein